MTRMSTVVVGLAWCLALSGSASAQSAVVPDRGRLVVTPVVVVQTFEDIWAGKARMTLPDSLTQQNVALAAELGLSDDVALDGTIGFSQTRSRAFGGPTTDRGLADTTVGVRWRFLNEHEAGQPHAYPTMALRVGGIVRGTYEANRPFSVGDGASGVDVTVLTDKTLAGGIGLQNEVGFRRRNNGVPADVIGAAGLYRSFGRITVSGAYRVVQGRSGPDIGDPDFQFRLLREVDHLVSGGVGVARGGRAYQIFAAHSVRGRNTGAKLLVGAAVTFDVRVR